MAKKKFWHDPAFKMMIWCFIILLLVATGILVSSKTSSKDKKRVEPMPVVLDFPRDSSYFKEPQVN